MHGHLLNQFNTGKKIEKIQYEVHYFEKGGGKIIVIEFRSFIKTSDWHSFSAYHPNIMMKIEDGLQSF